MSDSSADTGNAPSWLFSFVDLAFLSLIAMTQVMADADLDAPDLGDMVVPSLAREASEGLAGDAGDVWQLRVYPPDELSEGPFSLVQVPTDPTQPADRLTRDELEVEITALNEAGGDKPLLSPHRDSRSQDLLDSVALIQKLWPDYRRVVVARTLGGS
jgi:hypothetical protein